MLWILVSLGIVLALATGVVGVVVVGLEGRGRDHVPARIARRLRTAGRHLNGDAEPRQLDRLAG